MVGDPVPLGQGSILRVKLFVFEDAAVGADGFGGSDVVVVAADANLPDAARSGLFQRQAEHLGGIAVLPLGGTFFSATRIFSALCPASCAPRRNSSHRISELPPFRGLPDKINTFLLIGTSLTAECIRIMMLIKFDFIIQLKAHFKSRAF